MKKILFLLLATCVMAAELPSFDRLVVGGKAFDEVKVVAIEATGIRFMHATGAGRATFEELDAKVIEQLGVDQAKMKELALQEARAAVFSPAPVVETANAALLAPTIPKDAKWEQLSIKVAEKIGDGYLCYPHTPGGVKGSLARSFGSLTNSGDSNYVRPSTNYDRPLYVTGINGVAIGEALLGLATRVGIKEVNGQPYEHWVSKPK
jgi:hypothetical protein